MNKFKADREFKVLVVAGGQGYTTYRRLLQSDRHTRYEILQGQSTSEALEILALKAPDCILIDWETPNLNGRELLEQLDTDRIAAIALVSQRNEEILANLNQDYLVKETLTEQLLCRAVTQAIAQTELQRQLATAQARLETSEMHRQKTYPEQVINLMLQSMHSTFDLSTIFTTATTGIGKLFQLDRVEVIQYLSDRQIWSPVVEYLGSPLVPSALGIPIPDRENELFLRLRQGEIVFSDRSNDIYSTEEASVTAASGSFLLVPLVVGTGVWGILSLRYHGAGREWQNVEVDLANNMATQLGIAIQQSLVFQELQQELSDRQKAEQALQELTQELEQRVEQQTEMLQISARNAQESERRYEALVASAPVGIFRCDSSLNCIYVNDRWSEMTGRPKESALGEGWIDALHPDERYRLAGWVEMFDRITPDDFVLPPAEGRFLRPDGSVCWYYIQVALEFDAEGNAIGHVGTLTDITERKRAEITLQKSQERFGLATRAAGVGVWEWDLQTRDFYLDPAVKALLGYADNEIPNDLNIWTTYIHPDDLQPVMDAAQAHLNGETSEYICEHRMLHKDGSIRWIMVRGIAIRDAEGNAIRFVGTDTDITARKQTEIALRESERRYEVLIESSPVAIFRFDTPFNCVYVNNRWSEMTGRPAESALGRGWVEALHPDERDSIIAQLTEIYNQATPEDFILAPLEGRHLCPDGSINWYYVQLAQEIDLDGNVIGYIGSLTDITERKQIEIALQESERRYATLVASAPVGIFRFDTPFNCVYVNNRWSEMTGRPEESALGRGWIEALHPDERDHVLASWAEVYDQATPEDFVLSASEGRHLRPDGSINWYYGQVAQEIDSDGNVVGYIGTLTDITASKQAEAELLESRERLRQREELLHLTIENTPVGIATCDLETNFLTVNEAICQILGYSRAELLQMNAFELTHSDYLGISLSSVAQLCLGEVSSFQIEKQYVHKSGRSIDSTCRAALIKDDKGNPLHFVVVLEDITERKSAENALMKQAERARLLGAIAQRVRASLNIKQILDTTCTEVLQVLQADRVIVYHLFPDGTGAAIAESVGSNWSTVLNVTYPKEVFPEESQKKYSQGRVYALSDREDRSILPCLVEFLTEIQVRAKLVVPILKENYLWGLLIAHQCECPRRWQDWEISLMQQLADQLAIAIQQSELYERAQQEISIRQQFQWNLQKQAAADRLLSEVTLAISQSSSVDEVLSANLEKIRVCLQADRIVIFQFHSPSEGIIAKETVSRPELSILGTVIEDPCFTTTNLSEHYIQGKITRIEDLLTADITPCHLDLLTRMHVRANLAVPIVYDRELWGLLIVHQCDAPRQWEPDEINLVKQIVTQISIAAQKERLYWQVTSDLNQKKVLLKEIHHRVKNNLQIMSSLLYMQFRNASPEVRILSEEYQNRIQSMALIHDQLYRSDDLSSIDFHEYVTNLTDNLCQCYGTNSQLIQIDLDINNMFFPLDQAVPLGLIINEMVSNALKYAFPQRHGIISIQITQQENRFRLIVADNGIGISPDIDLTDTRTLGMQLVISLTEQLEGEFAYSNHNGLTLEIVFPAF